MNKPDYFTPFVYRKNANTPVSLKARTRQKVDNYFYLGGKKAYVIGKTKDGRDKVVICKSHASGLEIAGKLLSYATIVIPLVMLGTKAALRSKANYKMIDPKQKLEKGFDVSADRIQKISELMGSIAQGVDLDEIEWLQKGNNYVFRLKDDPTIVYKYSRSGSYDKQRYKNMVKAKAVCLANQLGLLVIPQSKIIQVGRSQLIAEQCMDIAFDATAQEELYHKYSEDLDETAKQLATFIARTGFNDVTWRNIPLINEKEDFQGPRRVALVDLEYMESVVNGFSGDPNSSIGLIRCVSKKQTKMVIKQGRKKGASLSGRRVKRAKKQRLEELKEHKELLTFYEKKEIKTGKERIEVDINALGLNLEESAEITLLNEELSIAQNKLVYEKKMVTLKMVTEDVIAEINRLIENSTPDASIKGKRFVCIDSNHEPFGKYSQIGLPNKLITEEDLKLSWMNQIMTALVEKEHIFKFTEISYSFYIQT